MCRKMVFLLLFLFFHCNLFAHKVFINNVFTKNINKEYFFIVDKTKKIFLIIKVHNDSIHIIKRLPNILLGEKPGDKFIKGDNKTPEGIYKIKSFISPKYLDKKYGNGAYPLNYPNPVDKILNKSGNGIWIHGINENEVKLYTHGCVALNNEQLNILKQFNPIGKYVIITNQIDYSDSNKYKIERNNWLEYLNKYIDFWQNNNFEKFKTFYHPLFKNKKRFLLYKKRLMRKYPHKRIFYNNVKILKEDHKEVLLNFRQLYCAKNLLDEGEKQLYLFKSKNNFQIIYENYKSKNFKLLKGFIKDFIYNWIHSWKTKNINKYIQFYSKNFKIKNFNINSWKNYKRAIFNHYKKIDINFYNLKYKIIAPTKIEVTFLQKYKADKYKDIGVKRLLLIGCPGNYKILKEYWRKK